MRLYALPDHAGLFIGGRWYPVKEGVIEVPEECVKTARAFGYSDAPPAETQAPPAPTMPPSATLTSPRRPGRG